MRKIGAKQFIFLEKERFFSKMRFAEEFEIDQILSATCGQFVGDELLAAKVGNGEIPIAPLDPPIPGLIPRNASDRGDQVDTNGRPPQLHDPVGLFKVVLYQSVGGKTKLGQGVENTPCIVQIWPDQKNQISCKSRHSVKSQGVPTDNHELNVVGGEQLEQLFEVWLSFRNIVGAAGQRRQPALRGSWTASKQGLGGRNQGHPDAIV
jgi:hypothetical protein